MLIKGYARPPFENYRELSIEGYLRIIVGLDEGDSQTFGTLRFDEKSFSNMLLSFTPYWGYKPTNAINADFPGTYTSEKKFKFRYNK